MSEPPQDPRIHFDLPVTAREDYEPPERPNPFANSPRLPPNDPSAKYVRYKSAVVMTEGEMNSLEEILSDYFDRIVGYWPTRQDQRDTFDANQEKRQQMKITIEEKLRELREHPSETTGEAYVDSLQRYVAFMNAWIPFYGKIVEELNDRLEAGDLGLKPIESTWLTDGAWKTGGLNGDSSDEDDDKKVPMPPKIQMTPELQAQIQQVEQQTPPPDDSMTPREAAYLRGEVPTARTPGLSLYQKAPPPRRRGPQPETETGPYPPPPAPAAHMYKKFYNRPPPPPQHPLTPYPAPQYYRPPPPVPPPPPQVPAYMQQPLPRNYQPPPPPPQPQPQGAFGMTRSGNIPGVQQPHPVWPPPPFQSGSRWGKSGDWNHRSWVDRDGKPPPS